IPGHPIWSIGVRVAGAFCGLRRMQLRLDLRQLLPDFGERSTDVGPVESHRGCPLLQATRHEKGGKGRNDAIEHWALALPPFDCLPWLGLTELEQVRMAPAHLSLEPAGHLFGAEFA